MWGVGCGVWGVGCGVWGWGGILSTGGVWGVGSLSSNTPASPKLLWQLQFEISILYIRQFHSSKDTTGYAPPENQYFANFSGGLGLCWGEGETLEKSFSPKLPTWSATVNKLLYPNYFASY